MSALNNESKMGETKHISSIIEISKYSATLLIVLLLATGCDGKKHNGKGIPNDKLKVVIIRHGEKPKNGDNLSCQGQNRALQLPAVLHQKINVPGYIFVPALEGDDSTKHSRMFQTISPFAIKYNVPINSKYSADENDKIAKSVFKKTGTVLMVWEHSAIQRLASTLGVGNPPQWEDADYDSIWMISYHDNKATLMMDKEGLSPSPACNF